MTDVAAGADHKNSSVTFLVSGNAEWPPLRSAWTWVRGLVKDRAPGAAVFALTSVSALWNTLFMRNRELATAQLAPDVLDKSFGGLRGHVVVWLFPGSFLAPVDNPDMEAIIPLVGQGLGRLDVDRALRIDVFDKLTTEDGRVKANDGASPALQAWAWALSPLAGGFFRQLHLIPVGAGAGIEALARKIHDRLRIDVYWNTAGLKFPDSLAPNVVQNGVTAQGQRFVDATDCPLAGKADEWLPGMMARAVGKAAT